MAWQGSKWSLVAAAACVVGALSMIGGDLSLVHYLVGSIFWFFSIGLAVAAGVTMLRKPDKQLLFSVAMTSNPVSDFNSQGSATSTPPTEQHVTS